MYTSLHVKYRQKNTDKQTTQWPDTNIPGGTWEYKIANNDNKYMH